MSVWSSTTQKPPALTWTPAECTSTGPRVVPRPAPAPRVAPPKAPGAPPARARPELVAKLARRLTELKVASETGRAQLWLRSGVSQKLVYRYVPNAPPSSLTVSLPRRSPLDEVMRRLGRLPRQYRS